MQKQPTSSGPGPLTSAKKAVGAWKRELPNRLTWTRIWAIPVILILYPLDVSFFNVLCAFIFAAAAITDILDGFLARKYNAQSKLGALLDPLADKMLVAAALLLIAYNKAVFPLLAGLLLCREIGVSGLRLIAMERGINIPVNGYGKFKTIFQDVGIFCLMINRDFLSIPMRPIGMTAMWVALLLSIYSAWLYFHEFWLRSKH